MLDRFFGKNTHLFIHILAILGVTAGLSLSRVVMSLGMMLMVLNLLLEGNFKTYWSNLKVNRLYHIILLFFLLQVVGLLWSTDLGYGLNDIKAKLPLLVVPTILIAKPIRDGKFIHLTLGVFVFTILITSLINFSMYQHWIGNRAYDDIRGMSFFCSHVRYSLLVTMSIAIVISAMRTRKIHLIGGLALFSWFTFYTFYSQIISGLLTFLGLLLVFFIYTQWNKRKWAVLTMISILTIILGVSISWIKSSNSGSLDLTTLPTHTIEGNPYQHYDKLITPETGKPLYLYYCEEELARDWKKYSAIPFDSLDNKGQPIKSTLTRFLASKDYTKDAQGLSRLTKNEIKLIEDGIGSSHHVGMMARIYGIKYQLLNESNPNGHSLLERIEYWKVGLSIFSKNYLVGVGTGDVQKAFDDEYHLTNSLLDDNKRNRAHNMFLTIALSFGIFGFALFIWLHYTFAAMVIKKNLVGLLFVSIILVSYLIEDTLETQTGVTFFALFVGIFAKTPDDFKS